MVKTSSFFLQENGLETRRAFCKEKWLQITHRYFFERDQSKVVHM